MWKQIEGYNDIYFVNNKGQVKAKELLFRRNKRAKDRQIQAT